MQQHGHNNSHYSDIIMSSMAFQITGVSIVCSTVYWGADQRKYPSSESLAFETGNHGWLVNSPSKRPVMWKIFSFDDVLMLPEYFSLNTRMVDKSQMWWHHQMKIFSALLALCAGNSPVTWALIFYLIFTRTNGWVNNRNGGDWRHHCTHYDITVMDEIDSIEGVVLNTTLRPNGN